MRKILFALGLLCCLTLPAQDLKSLYVALPDSLSPLLTKVNREDFGDFLASNMKAEVKNRFGKTSEMKVMTDDYLSLQVSSCSSVQMKLLPLNDSVKVVCVVETFLGPVPDSKISFYDTSWKQLPLERFLTLPSEDAFYLQPVGQEQADSLQNLRQKADMFLMEAHLSQTSGQLEFNYTTPLYLDRETAEQLKSYVRKQPLVYVWKNGTFKPVD